MSKSKTTNHPSKSGGGIETSRGARNEMRSNAIAKRVPMHASSIAHVPKGVTDTDNFHYRWCADYGKGKIERYSQAAYEFVTDDEGDKIKRPGGDELWLMRIPKNLWDEDQEVKRGRQIQIHNENLKKEAQLKTGAVPEYLPIEQNML